MIYIILFCDTKEFNQLNDWNTIIIEPLYHSQWHYRTSRKPLEKREGQLRITPNSTNFIFVYKLKIMKLKKIFLMTQNHQKIE